MSMVQCRACGRQTHEGAVTCPACGAPQGSVAPTAAVWTAVGPLPEGVKGWSWGAFFLHWIWAVGNGVWIGLLVLVPVVGFVMLFVLGARGREWAWRARPWESVEQFQRVQRNWALWGVGLFVGPMLVAIAVLVSTVYQFVA